MQGWEVERNGEIYVYTLFFTFFEVRRLKVSPRLGCCSSPKVGRLKPAPRKGNQSYGWDWEVEYLVWLGGCNILPASEKRQHVFLYGSIVLV